MVREDLIASAVSFLQDPSVIGSPLDKRTAFLQSKNLTQEEIDIALARAGDSSSQSTTSAPPPPPFPQGYGYPNQQMTRQPGGYGYGYGPYPTGPWAQTLEPPCRDWRDYFIVATLTSTLGYTLYALSRRYILPLISPPTPPQLESDKASIDASFSRAFALIDQLASDTSDLKSREEERTTKLDKSLEEVNAVVEEIKDSNKKREVESRMLADQVHSLRGLVPQALEGWKSQGDGRLEELGAEVRSLKKLLSTRLGNSTSSSSSSATLNPPSLSPSLSASQLRTSSNPPPVFGSERDRSQERRSSGAATTSAGDGLGGEVARRKASYEGAEMGEKMAPAPGMNVPKREGTSTPGLGRSGKATIPAWQMAAAGRAEGGSGDSGS
ncbi:MAG: hypothetical protein LQ343_003506 [Gyalolechia ehrenbergii]|nr:MAG: hypothetical protein LQ343_003506 [Gyalolechia ehrenbergii]